MSLPESYEILHLGDESLELRVRRAAEARELMRWLLGSKAAAHRVLVRRQLLLDGVPLSPASLVGQGDVLSLRFHRGQEPYVTSDGPVDVVFQDSVLLAADKPARLLVHGDGTGADTLTERVQGHLSRQGLWPAAQPVQRLDVDTTGLVLFSLTEEFQPALDAQVAGHDMNKRYLAVIEGHIARVGEWVDLRGPIARDRHDARRMRVGATGKPAHTRVRTLEQRDGRSLLLVELMTGRRHQIRVHLAHASHPIVGDALYGGVPHREGLMLHAWQERLLHPVTGEAVELSTAVPDRFVRLFPGCRISEQSFGTRKL